MRANRSTFGPERDARTPVPWVELAILVVGIVLFAAMHAVVGHDVGAATANARTLQSLERTMGLDVEPTANRWLVGHPALAVLAAGAYRLYYVVLVGVVAWVWWRHRDRYVHVRRVLLALAAVALLVYWAVPMSPPRFSLPGTVDVVSQHDLFGAAASSSGARDGATVYTAMPSMHVGWSAWCAYAVWFSLRPTRPRLARAAWAFPALMVCIVVGTGSHYVLDVVGSALVLTVAVVLARLRPGVLRGPTACAARQRSGAPDSR
jgi:hypothetical protein